VTVHPEHEINKKSTNSIAAEVLFSGKVFKNITVTDFLLSQ